MHAYVGVTDGDWFRFLAARGYDEVNFWQPSGGRAFHALEPGEPFLFKTHYRDPAGSCIVGGGLFFAQVELSLSEAWKFFGEANGAPSYEEMFVRIQKYRRAPLSPSDDPKIGCLILEGVRYFSPGEYVSPPPDWAPNIVQGKGYECNLMQDYFHPILSRLRAAPTGGIADFQSISVPSWQGAGPIYGQPHLVRPRLGQGGFQAGVLKAYRFHCAVTGDKIRPVLQAAHIRPVSHGGEHRLDNGLLLRSDVHTLFDRGYLGIDPSSYRLLVSPRLRREFGNGKEFYVRAESRIPIDVPASVADRPSREFLNWHADEVFLAS
ncbi:MAG TPA: HNH endonuclease [Nocardioidaceae bacterium]|nr:HNH endonuclease [Nocardioidaceae bacterium]